MMRWPADFDSVSHFIEGKPIGFLRIIEAYYAEEARANTELRFMGAAERRTRWVPFGATG